MHYHLTDISPGFARIILDGQDIGIVEKLEHRGQILHDEDAPGEVGTYGLRNDSQTVSEIVSHMMWSPIPKNMERAALTENNFRHIDGGYTTRKTAVHVLIADHIAHQK